MPKSVATRVKSKARKPAAQKTTTLVSQRVRIWTWKYEPFQLGGMGGAPCQRPVAVEVPATGPYDLGNGFHGYLVTGPSGQTVVAEAESGGIVGDSVQQVRADIAACKDPKMMREQVRESTGYGKMAELLTAEAFWRLYCK